MIVHRTPTFLLAALPVLAGSGCYTAQLDPDLVGLFACDRDDEDAGCPEGQACVNERCEDAEAVPRLTILAPEDEAPLAAQGLGLPMGPPPALPPVEIGVTFQGTLELVAQGTSEHELGQGHVRVIVDGQEQHVVDEGSIAATARLTIRVSPVAGAHRVMLQAVRNDGIAYDNPEATATRLFWLEDESERGNRPLVAIKSPWPGTAIGLETEDIEVQVATLNFELIAPGEPRELGFGHAHVYYDQMFPGCGQQLECDERYLGVTGDEGITIDPVTLPPSGEQAATLTASLRHNDHTPYGFPLGCNPLMAQLEVCSPLFETIEILRVDD